MKTQSRLPAYPFLALLLPVISLIRGLFEIGVITSIAFIALFLFDPVFKFYRKHVKNYSEYLLFSFLFGLIISILSIFNPEQVEGLILLWLIPTTITSLVFVNKAKKHVYK